MSCWKMSLFGVTLESAAPLLVNYLSSISIVFLNKVVYNYGFPNLALTLLHFLVTFIGLRICASLGIFEIKKVNIPAVIPLCLSFCGFVVLTNYSLQYNTVGFYQLAKVLTTPCIVVIQSLYYNTTFSWPIKLSLLPICVGVALASNADTSTTTTGLIFAIAGVFVTSFYQIWVQTKQKELDLNPYQLLYYQAPISSVMLAAILPFLEPPFEPQGVFGSNWPSEAWGAVFGSAIVAFVVNLSIFVVIGRTSPITYNVLGHFKLCTVIAGGFLIFGDPLNRAQGMGIVLTLIGVFTYTHLKLNEPKAPAKTVPLSGVTSSPSKS
eukprot:m.93456 g.93456  ORF g.93456 m.93456 type:complete len:323 (+) comp8538_c0_seq1:2133-3101(+)